MEGVGLSVFTQVIVFVPKKKCKKNWGLIRITDNQQLVMADTDNDALWFL